MGGVGGRPFLQLQPQSSGSQLASHSLVVFLLNIIEGTSDSLASFTATTYFSTYFSTWVSPPPTLLPNWLY